MDRRIWLRVTVSPPAQCQFSYSGAGVTFAPIGDCFPAASSKWVGAKVGIFASAAPGGQPPGHADFAGFQVAK